MPNNTSYLLSSQFGIDLKKAIDLLYYWQYQSGDSFTCRLYELFQKADPGNQARLAMGFPVEAIALHKWKSSGDNGDDLFREFGLLT